MIKLLLTIVIVVAVGVAVQIPFIMFGANDWRIGFASGLASAYAHWICSVVIKDMF